jgi:elongator complex protein 3
MDQKQAWLDARQYTQEHLDLARLVLDEVREGVDVAKAIRRHPLAEGGFIAKHVLIHVYRSLVQSGVWAEDPDFLQLIRMKPARTLSGVTTVSVLTKPYPCPGECIFCPTDLRMPKSYLPDEPGAMRALHHDFDPYRQTQARMDALEAIGHPTDKIELLILGGTWSTYESSYQEWFIQRCLDAMNAYDSSTLLEAQKTNEKAEHRNVGLVIETRPDWITPEEVRRLRNLGVTKVQLGLQSMDDALLSLNHRGHQVEESRKAMSYLRAAGIKIVIHWMPNLYGATFESDRKDFVKLWDDPGIRPDEMKIYPCQLLQGTELYELWKKGDYRPYTTQELIELIADLKPSIPRYCRVNRVLRDIPSDNVVEGNKRSSIRQDVHQELKKRGSRCECIRCREIRDLSIDQGQLQMEYLGYTTLTSEEYFLSFLTPKDRLAGYLRLSLPGQNSPNLEIPEIQDAALVREVHIYGQSLTIGEEQSGAAQHSGLGFQLMNEAEQIAKERGFCKIAVIAALGTRGYYRRLGYDLDGTYMVKDLE